VSTYQNSGDITRRGSHRKSQTVSSVRFSGNCNVTDDGSSGFFVTDATLDQDSLYSDWWPC